MSARGRLRGQIDGRFVPFWRREWNVAPRQPAVGTVSPGNRRYVLPSDPKTGRNHLAVARKGGSYGESRLRTVRLSGEDFERQVLCFERLITGDRRQSHNSKLSVAIRARDTLLLQIETERLLLRPTEISDADAIFAAYASDPVATRFLPFETITDIDRVVKYLERTVKERIHAECVTWVIILRDNQRLIGTLDLTIDENISNIGFTIGRAWWGMGIVPEAARAVLDFARNYLGIQRVRGQCDYENRQSARVFEKLGFQQTGLKEAASKVPSIGPDLRPALLFELEL